MSKCPEVYRNLLGEGCDDIWANEDLKERLVQLIGLCYGEEPCLETKTADTYCESCKSRMEKRKKSMTLTQMGLLAAIVT